MLAPGGIPSISQARPESLHELRAHLPEDLLPKAEACRDPQDEILLGPCHPGGIGARDLEEQAQEEDPALERRDRGVVAAEARHVDSLACCGTSPRSGAG